MNKGLIALDIDGTLTTDRLPVSIEVAARLKRYASEGWKICLITGRGLARACDSIGQFSFPYHLAVHNGALILEMPNQKILKTSYLESSALPQMEKVFEDEETDFLIYSGPDDDYSCFYRPHRFDKEMLQYLERRSIICKEEWKATDDFRSLNLNHLFAVKCFGTRSHLERIVRKAEQKLDLYFPIIKDNLREGFFVAQATHSHVSKGSVVAALKEILGIRGPVIAAGDDANDIPLFRSADFKVAMGDAHPELMSLADFIAPSAKEKGILPALNVAMSRLS